MGWTNDQLFEALKRYERACEDAGLNPISVQSYVDYSRRFIRWRDGDYRPRNATGPFHRSTASAVTTTDLMVELKTYERELQAARLRPRAVVTYLVHSTQFVRWLDGRFAPGATLGGSSGKRAQAPPLTEVTASTPGSAIAQTRGPAVATSSPLTARGRSGARIEIRRITSGPTLVIEDAERLALDFFRTDPSSAAGGYDDLAGHGDRDRITRSDIVAINTTMRARSPHTVWDALISSTRSLGWLAALDPMWGLVELDRDTWQSRARPAVERALDAAVGPGRGLSVATKVLHLKRPRMFPVLDSLVLQQLGVTESIGPMRVIDHLRAEGQRNLEALRAVQVALAGHYDRSLVRILDVLLWTSHPAAGLAPALRGWQHVLRHEQ